MEAQPEASPFLFLSLISGKWSSHVLAAAAELRVADILKDEPLDANEVAARANTNPDLTYRLLRALTTLGILRSSDGQRFELASLGMFLRSDVAGSMRALSMMGGRAWHDRCWEHLAQSVRTGKSGAELAFGNNLWEHFSTQPEDFQNFNEAMTAASAGMHFTAANAYDFSRFKVLADVGGGFGRLIGLVLQKTPGLRGILFDRPALAEGAKAELDRLGVSDRCEFVEGDFFKQVPSGADAYMMGHILHDWDDERAKSILTNCRRVMAAGNTLLVLDAVIKGGPQDFGTLMDLEIFLLFGGRDRTEQEFATLFAATGFRLNRVISTQSSISIVEGIAI